ncbi:MAG: glycosyl hydrolase 53 family protein [Tepidisphaeraceae bacterium]|jgi:arabinogalactan endo-1,4-beta-galactosidase
MPRKSSRLPLFVLMGFLLMVPKSSPAASTQPGPAPPFLLGADISALAQVEQRGGVFSDHSKPDDAIAIFRQHGWNCFRLRLFVNPNGRGGTVNTLDYTRALAKRITASGAVFILDIHYSDTWADPQHQIKPAAWKNLDFDGMENAVAKYTADVLADLKKNGCSPQIVQIGNEITGGTLWPDAQVAVPLSTVKVYDSTVKPIKPPQPYDDVKQWDRFCRILSAGARGVRQATTPSDHVRIMIHIDCGGDWPVTRWFFDHLTEHKIDYDIIGQSYYPYWHGTLQNVQDNLRETANRFHKDIVIVETAYPWKDAARWSARKNMAWPISPDGQRKFLADLISAVRQTPDAHGLGVIYWHPESVPVRSPAPNWNGGDMALFNSDGNALPAIELYKPD